MDILLGLFVGFLMYVLPFLLAGGVVFGGVFFIGFVLSRFVERASKLRTNILLVSSTLGLILGVVLCIPLVFYTYKNMLGEKDRLIKNFEDDFVEQIKGGGRGKYWPAGTVTDIDRWLDQADEKLRDKGRKEFALKMAVVIVMNKLATNDSDLIIISKLANLPAQSEGYPDGVIASARAYIRIKDIGYSDLGHPQRFTRSPGHNDSAEHRDYVTYLRLLMRRCVDAPDAKCREVFTPEYLAGLERIPHYPLDWMQLRESLPPLRAALGYPRGKEDN